MASEVDKQAQRPHGRSYRSLLYWDCKRMANGCQRGIEKRGYAPLGDDQSASFHLRDCVRYASLGGR